jgi:hypothetical protein
MVSGIELQFYSQEVWVTLRDYIVVGRGCAHDLETGFGLDEGIY